MANLGFQVRVTTKGKDPFEWMKEVQMFHFVKAEAILVDLAEETVNNMTRIIEDNRKNPARPGSRLQNSIGWEEVLNVPGERLVIGIGNIERMNKEAPYWELINSGGTYMTKETHIVPTTFFASPESDFLTFKAGDSHVIEPVRYIDTAAEQLRKRIAEEFDKAVKELEK